MATAIEIVPNPANEWRLDAPKVEGWVRDVRPGPNKHFMVSVDTHMTPPVKLFHERMDSKFHDLLPRSRSARMANAISSCRAHGQKG